MGQCWGEADIFKMRHRQCIYMHIFTFKPMGKHENNTLAIRLDL